MTPVEFDGSALKSSVAFTGRLTCMSRAEAFDVVRQRGGTPSRAVTKRTRLPIVGELILKDSRADVSHPQNPVHVLLVEPNDRL
jgi:NAD-dependent DNA ligase